MGTDKNCNTSKHKVMHIQTTGYKLGAHNLQMIEKDKDLSATTWAQNKHAPEKPGKYVSRVSDIFPAQLEKYRHVHSK